MNNRLLLLVAASALAFSSFCLAAQSQKAPGASEKPACPEMDRVWKLFGGEWDTTESMERSEFYPNGGGRKGMSHWRLATGGTTLIGEGHSDGSAGPLDYLTAIWWDSKAKLYGFFICFKASDSSCGIRGTAHWEGDTFVNEYEESVRGKSTKMRDTWLDITPNSHTLVWAIDTGNEAMKPVVTSRSTRRSKLVP